MYLTGCEIESKGLKNLDVKFQKQSVSYLSHENKKKTQIDSKLLIKVHQNTGYKTEGRIIRVLLVNTRDRFVLIITLKEEHVVLTGMQE